MMDLPDTLDAVLSEIVTLSYGEWQRWCDEQQKGAAALADVTQARITALAAQKDLLLYRERTAHMGRGNGQQNAASTTDVGKQHGP